MIAVPTVKGRIASGQRLIAGGRLLIEHHRKMIERYKAEGRDTKAGEKLLAVLERTQKVFEREVSDLEKRQ
jgi:hypothetical protein